MPCWLAPGDDISHYRCVTHGSHKSFSGVLGWLVTVLDNWPIERVPDSVRDCGACQTGCKDVSVTLAGSPHLLDYVSVTLVSEMLFLGKLCPGMEPCPGLCSSHALDRAAQRSALHALRLHSLAPGRQRPPAVALIAPYELAYHVHRQQPLTARSSPA